MAITFITPVEVSPDVADAWTDCDVSAHIPSTAVGVILRCTIIAGTSRPFGLRKNGSTDNRITTFLNNWQQCCFIGCDGGQIFEVWQGGTATDIDIRLVGYFEAADAHFFTNAIDKSTATTGSFVDVDITGDLQGGDTAPKGAILEFVDVGEAWGVRVNGSSDSRVRRGSGHTWAMVGVDAGDIFEQHIQSISVDCFEVGYLKSTANFTFVDPGVADDPASADTWLDLATVTGARGILYEQITTNDTPRVMGFRKNGSSEALLFRSRHEQFLVEADGSGIVEGYQDETGFSDFWRIGYVTTPSAGGAIAGTSAGVATVTGVLTATGLLSGTSAGTATVTGTLVDIVGQVSVPDATISAGDWLNELASATDLHLSVDEYPTPNDADYIESDVTPSTVRLRLSDILPPEFTP
jgi:hypothetical protein